MKKSVQITAVVLVGLIGIAVAIVNGKRLEVSHPDLTKSQSTSLSAPSEEQIEHQQAIKSCFNSRAAGVHWYQGGELGDYCRQAHPDRVDRARAEITNLLKVYNLAPDLPSHPELLPEGDCKTLAQRYVQLNDAAYHLNSGPAKDALLSEASTLDAIVRQGSCVLPNSGRSKG